MADTGEGEDEIQFLRTVSARGSLGKGTGWGAGRGRGPGRGVPSGAGGRAGRGRQDACPRVRTAGHGARRAGAHGPVPGTEDSIAEQEAGLGGPARALGPNGQPEDGPAGRARGWGSAFGLAPRPLARTQNSPSWRSARCGPRREGVQDEVPPQSRG